MDPLTIVFNFFQQLDALPGKNLKAHTNKIICFHVNNFDPLYFKIDEQGLLKKINVTDGQINLTFSGPLSSFMNMILTKKVIPTAGLHVRGDLELAQAFYESWTGLDIDWEGKFAQVVGDNLAHALSQGFKNTSQWFKETMAARQKDVGDYLQHESKLLPTKEEVEQLFKDIDKIRHDVDRFEARLRKHLCE